jgi:RimJ/RimL family protein N-acetyltransferase
MKVELRAYTDADLALTQALEGDPEMMRHLGGPSSPEEIEDAHRRRLGAPWWFVIEADGTAAGTIGIWENEHEGERIHETGWLVLPAHQGRGVASAALELLLERAREELTFDAVYAFPGVENVASNAICRKFGFELVGDARFDFRGQELHCNVWRLDTSVPPPGA